MTDTILDQQELTADQQTALDLVEARPGLTVEEYANGDPNLCNAFYWLVFNRYVKLDPTTQAVTKG